MDIAVTPSTPEQSPRKRSKSTLLKSFVTPKSRTSSPTKNTALREIPNEQCLDSFRPPQLSPGRLVLPADHPHANQLLASKGDLPRDKSVSPRKSSIQDTATQALAEDSRGGQVDGRFSMKRKLQLSIPKDKENAAPTGPGSPTSSTPIWSQFASGSPQRGTPSLSYRKDFLGMKSFPRDVPVPASSIGSREGFHPKPKSWFNSKNTIHDEADSSSLISQTMPLTPVEAFARTEFISKSPKQAIGDSHELDAALEAVLDARNVAENLRRNMRNLDVKIKADLVRHGQAESRKLDRNELSNSSLTSLVQLKSPTNERGRSTRASAEDEATSPSKRGRSRSRVFTFGKSDSSSSKNPRSLSRPRSLMSLKNLSSKNLSSSSVHSFGLDGSKESKERMVNTSLTVNPTTLATPEDFVKYLQATPTPQQMEIGKMHKLRLLTRNESISWVNSFISQKGMDELVALLDRIMAITWREEHDDLLLHEVLHCLKGLSTTQPGLDKLSVIASSLFPALLKMLFDVERKGPSEYSTRGVVINLMFIHLAAASSDQIHQRAETLLGFLSDPAPAEEQTSLPFILEMRRRRPYQVWSREISTVSKEVFWIFMHHHNVIAAAEFNPLDNRPYAKVHFPKDRAPVAAAPYVGGVEWEATNYIGDHLDLMNGLIAAQPDRESRNILREHMRASGFERVMGKTLRTCKEKFYGAVHDGLSTWITAANEDGWPTQDVQVGPTKDTSRSPTKGNRRDDPPPQIQLPKLDFGDEASDAQKGEGWI